MKKSTTIYGVAILMCITMYTRASADPTSIRNAFDQALNAHDLDAMMSYTTDDVVYDYVPLPTPFAGKEAVRGFFADLFAGFPDFATTEGRILAASDIIVVEHSTTGTHQGEWLGIPATGLPSSAPHIDIYEFEGDKIKRVTTYLDAASVLVQLGVTPAPDMPEFIPSFTLPDAEPTGLAPLKANAAVIAGWNSHDMVNYSKMLHKDFEMFAGPVGVQMNRDQWVAMSEMYFQIFTGAHIEIVRVVDMGNGWVLTEEISSGVQDGPFFGVPPTGRNAKVRAVLLGHFDSDGLLTDMSYYFDNMTIMAQLTAVEWPIDGVWVTTAPTPLGNIILKAAYFAQDAAKTKFTAQVEQINGYPLLAELYPDAEGNKFVGGQLNKIGVNAYQATLVGYFTKKSGLQMEEIVGIVVITGDLTVTGPDTASGQGYGAYYLASQDANSDGLPDDGEEPVTCLPWVYNKKRVKTMSGCVPMPMP